MNVPEDHKHYRADVDRVEDVKESNPKEAIGSSKCPLHLVPPAAEYYAAEAFLEGALKYGAWNWRVAGVRASTYVAALKSHINKWYNGQDRDPETLVHELGSARACIDVLIDAIECGVLTDDRPPAMPAGTLEKLRRSPVVARLLERYPVENAPKPFTQAASFSPQGIHLK